MKPTFLPVWRTLASIDRRIIYLLLTIVVVLPLIIHPKIKVRVSEPVRAAFESIEKLPQNSVVMISIDFDPSSAPEVQPMLIAILRHCFKKNLKVILTGQLALGLPLGEIALNQVSGEYNKVYGRDYVNIGYRPGSTALMVGIGREIRDFFKTDYRGVPLDSFEFMRRVHNYHDIALLVTLAHGAVADAWIQYAGARFNQKIIVGCTGVNAPNMYQYLSAQQITGLIGGLQGASEYETLVEKPGAATLGMPAQSTAHALLIILLIIGNIGFILSKKKI
ncbi:MAG: hypothetical protein N2248_03725 [candidate division WOR-3 bacterium]|uniref:Uncharacterized protein n=1 Tax=candidate division WOR-3 bacterium TaxID=2052148 RepID=A0A7C1NEJ3_UNCW3|nr:hypothetical protein [candidate division WOR-3 bacterium]